MANLLAHLAVMCGHTVRGEDKLASQFLRVLVDIQHERG